MCEELNKIIQEAEVQHDKLVVLHARTNEQINRLKEENKNLINLLIASKGNIQGYKKALDIINKDKE